jgi:hypothetical protein
MKFVNWHGQDGISSGEKYKHDYWGKHTRRLPSGGAKLHWPQAAGWAGRKIRSGS